MRSYMAQHGEASAGDCLCRHALRIVRDGFGHGAANVERTPPPASYRAYCIQFHRFGCWRSGDRPVALRHSMKRRAVSFTRAGAPKMFKRGDQRRFDLSDCHVHFAGPFSQRNGELIARAPRSPGGIFPEPAGRLAERVLECASEALWGFESRVQGDVDNPVFRHLMPVCWKPF